MALDPGLVASFEHVVTDHDTAIAFGSGDVPVLATPKVVALVERATVLCVCNELTSDLTTVGVRVGIDHVLPAAVGSALRVDAVLDAVDGRRLSFGVRVSTGDRTLAEGTVVRLLVTRERFLRVVG